MANGKIHDRACYILSLAAIPAVTALAYSQGIPIGAPLACRSPQGTELTAVYGSALILICQKHNGLAEQHIAGGGQSATFGKATEKRSSIAVFGVTRSSLVPWGVCCT